MIDCHLAGEQLLVAGARAIDDDAELAGHVADCAQCRRLVVELTRLDRELGSLTRVDAPDALAAKTVGVIAVAGRRAQPRNLPGDRRKPAWLTAFATAVVVISTVGLTFDVWRSPAVDQSLHSMSEFEDLDFNPMFAVGESHSVEQAGPGSAGLSSAPRSLPPMGATPAEISKGRSATSDGLQGAKPRGVLGAVDEDSVRDPRADSTPAEYATPALNEARPLSPPPPAPADNLAPVVVEGLSSLDTAEPQVKTETRSASRAAKRKTRKRYRRKPAKLVEAEELQTPLMRRGSEAKRAREQVAAKVTAPFKESGKNDKESRQKKQMAGNEVQTLPSAESDMGVGEDESSAVVARTAGKTERHKRSPPNPSEKALAQGLSAAPRPSPAGDAATVRGGREQPKRVRTTETAEEFLRSLETLEGLRFQQARGYWLNTYIPGDAVMRLLGERLQAKGPGRMGNDLAPAHSATPNTQPFDAPTNAAMALYLQADKRAISGPTRMRLQVGLRGAQRQGRRPAMNVGVVLNLGDAPTRNTLAPVRALLAALQDSRQPGDRFSLTAAGADGGLLVKPAEFRHGPLSVALKRLFGAGTPRPGASRVNLVDAVSTATAQARAEYDPTAVLGSSLVLLITAAPLAPNVTVLEGIAHRNATTGIPLSVVSVGHTGDLDAADRLTAAGQGNRRLLAHAEDAARLVDSELHSASRAVARAARLRIRLAANIDLIGIYGSRRLDEPQAMRVREAEQSIDRRMAENLGIKADRGDDEDGIQIVIPNFYAGDTHVVMLDVVARQPGPIADVTLRFKDLVHLRNGVARAELRVANGSARPGPLQRNVLKNRVTLELAAAARSAGALLTRGQRTQAQNTLVAMHRLLLDLRRTVPGWTADDELLGDAQRLARYIATLQMPAAVGRPQQRFLADSLRYMAFRKLMPAPKEPRP